MPHPMARCLAVLAPLAALWCVAPSRAAPPPGIVICEPVPKTTDAALSDFGAGCGRWLFFTVGGRPEFGQTSLWNDVERAPRELGRHDLRLAPPDAAKLSGILGVTHAAVGTISGTAARCVLTYQLYAVPSRTPLGLPLRDAGTEAQIITQLPALAQTLMRRLGLPAAPRPAAPAAAPADFVLLGQVPWGPSAVLAPSQEAALLDRAPRLPLAGLLALNVGLRPDTSRISAVAQALAAQSPNNPLVYGQIGYVSADALAALGTALDGPGRRFPRSYGLAHADVWRQRATGDAALEMRAARRTVTDAPRSPDAWLTYGYTLANKAEDIRRGKFAAEISDREQAQLDVLYPQWLAAVRRAASLDPRYGLAWLRVATAATFQGEDKLADVAFWNAQRLDRDHAAVYGWGLQMYQPKWGGDPATLVKVANLAAAQHYDDPTETIQVAYDLGGAGFHDKQQALMARAVAESRDAVQRHPESPNDHYGLARALELSGHAADAIPEYRTVTRLTPNDTQAHLNLGLVLYDAKQWDEAMGEYRQAIRLDPGNEQAHVQLGWGLKHTGHLDEAVQELNAAIRLKPDDGAAHAALGAVWEIKGQRTDAIAEYQKAYALYPSDKDTGERLLTLLDGDNQLDAALTVGKQLLTHYPDDSIGWIAVADVFLKQKDWGNALDASDQAIKADAKSGYAHENRAEALLGLGRKDEARAEWQQVINLGPEDAAKASRDFLAKNP